MPPEYTLRRGIHDAAENSAVGQAGKCGARASDENLNGLLNYSTRDSAPQRLQKHARRQTRTISTLCSLGVCSRIAA